VILRLTGAFFVAICFLTLTQGMAVGVDVEGLIRLAVWIGLVKSLLMCWWPRHLISRMDRVFSRPVLVRPFGLVALAAGVVFLLAGKHLQDAGL